MIYCHIQDEIVPKEKANCRDYGDWPSAEFLRLKADEICQSCPFNSKPELELEKWDKLRMQLKNLLTCSMKEGAKRGIKMALDCMDLIEEAEKK